MIVLDVFDNSFVRTDLVAEGRLRNCVGLRNMCCLYKTNGFFHFFRLIG